jgi:hypothetical protein
VVKNIKLIISFYPKEMNLFPLEFFQITYDTKNICLSKYNHNKISLLYKKGSSGGLSLNSGGQEDNREYEEKIIKFKDKILYLKEMQKDFSSYLNYPNSTIFFILLENLNFLIVRKIFEIDEATGESYPDIIILQHIDISTQTEYLNFPFVSFSLLYDNENPIFRHSNETPLDYSSELSSGIYNPEGWYKFTNKNTLESDTGLMNLTSFYHKNISIDFLLINLKENLVLYKIEGLHSHPYNNLNISSTIQVKTDVNFSSKFLLLKMTKTLDRKYCVYFLDQNNLIRKYNFEDSYLRSSRSLMPTDSFYTDNHIPINDSEKTLNIFSNISYCEFNDKNRKTFLLEHFKGDITEDKKSIITILNSKLEISKLIIFKKEFIQNLHWIENSDFLIFTLSSGKIGIIFYFSKFLNKKINEVDEEYLKDKFILIDLKNPQSPQLKSQLDEFGINFNSDEILHLKLDSIFNITPHIQKPLKSKNHNDIKFELLIITNQNLILSEISIESFSGGVHADKIGKNDENLNLDKNLNHSNHTDSTYQDPEFISKIIFKNSEFTSRLTDKTILKTGEVIFNEDKIYYCDMNSKTNIFSVKEIDSNNLKHNTVFQLLALDELYWKNIFYNNYIIFITQTYINSYDLSSGTFYRVRNDIVKDKNIPSKSIDLIKFGIYLYLVFITNESIRLIRIPRNKNKNEQLIFTFNYNFEISKNYSKVLIRNNCIILNESQIVRFADVTTTQHNLNFESENLKTLMVINSNPSSLYDMDTFTDFLLSGNEEIVKLILNMFCDLFKNVDNFKDIYKNTKMIPNFYKLEHIEYVVKVIFENDLNLMNLGEEYAKILEEQSQNLEGLQLDLPLKATRDRSSSTRKSLSQFNNLSKLKFKLEEDESEKNPINIICSSNQNLRHLKNVYEVISSENTRNVDNFTKYFILKMMYKTNELESNTFKLSTADLCWISLINDQEYLLKFLSKSSKSKDYSRNINWKFMKMFSIPLWIKNDYKLKELMEIVGRNEYKLQKEQEISTGTNINQPSQETSILKNYAENVALYFFLANKPNTILELFDKELHNEAVKKFIMRDFSVEKNRKLAKKHAGDLIDKKKYLFAAYFFLLADDIHSALDMTLVYLKDFNLTIAIIKLYQSPYGNEAWKKFYSIDKLYQEYFINYGIAIRDPWLVTYGYIGQGKIDLALEYILEYDQKYQFEQDKKLMESLESGGDDYLDIIRKIYAINVFDYKLLLFAKNLEKIYLKQLDEMKANVKSVQNTNFEDIWDMDDFGGGSTTTTQVVADGENENQNQLKEISINYYNLSYLSLVNVLKRGALFSPIIYHFKQTKKNKPLSLDPYCRDLLKILISDRIVLDVNFIKDETSVENYFHEIEKFFQYLLDTKIINHNKELYLEINRSLLWLDSYRSTAVPCFKSEKILETLLTVMNFSEKLISRNLSILTDFNFSENLNLKKVNENILVKIREMNEFISKLSKLILLNENHMKQIEDFDVKFKFQKMEQTLYIFRLFFIFLVYLLFLAKILISFNKVTLIFDTLKELVMDYKKLEKFSEKIFKYCEFINLITIKLSKKILKEINIEHVRSLPTSFYIQILNISIISQIKYFIVDNLEIGKNSLKKFKTAFNENYHDNLCTSDHYIHEQFKFIYQLLSLTNYNLDNFEQNLHKYIKNYTDVVSIFDIHEELKMIYMKNLSQESNFFKYSLIPIKTLFKTPDKLRAFEEKFELKKNMLKYMSNICKYVRYERVKVDSEEQVEGRQFNMSNNLSVDFRKYSRDSVRIVNQIFKNGIDVVNFGEGHDIQDFAINNCDVSNFAISLLNQGHKKINIMSNLLLKRRSDGKQKNNL